LTSSDLAHLTAAWSDLDHSERVHIEAGEVLITEGGSADTVYLLLRGSLEVSRMVNGIPTVLATVDRPGSLVGEMVTLGGGTRTATVTAKVPSDLVSTTNSSFKAFLEAHSDLADELVAIAVRRAEEGELADLLAEHFGIVDENTLVSTCGAVDWLRVAQGEVLMREGDTSDAMYFVIRGRLLATRFDETQQEQVEIGELGRGDAVGEIGLMSGTPRSATVTALRDTVVAGLSEDAFLDLVDRQPRMAIQIGLQAVARAEDTRWHAAPTSVLAIASVAPDGDDHLVTSLVEELGRHGKVHRLSPEIVDLALESPGVSDSGRGDIGEIRVSRMVHEVELAADYLIVELGREPGAWTRRALGLADRVLIVIPDDFGPTEEASLDRILGGCPTGVKRTVVISHPSPTVKPSGSATLKERFSAENVIHIARSSQDVSKLARVSVGRGNSLILGGGGGRGFAHIGVYRALTELGFPVDIAGGTSIGGVVAAVIANAMTADDIVDWAAEHFPDVLDYTLPVVSLTRGRRIARAAQDTFGTRDIEDLWNTYFAMSTDLTTSHPHIHETGSVALAIRATSAIPGVMPPVPFGDALLIDGGILNNLPIDVARQKSPDGRVVAVDVAPPRGPGAHGDYGLSVSGWQALRSNFGSGRSPYPKISAVLMRSMITASMRERDRQVLGGLADCYLDLDIRGVSMLDFDDPSGVAVRGYDAAMPALESWMELELDSSGV
jgi:predicted acylesterase/phospholipase RssA/CRP-like cAMP-binding protein